MGSIISRRRANAQEPRQDEVLVAEPHDQSVRSVSVTGAGHSLPDENAPEPGHEDASGAKRVAAAGMRDRAAQRREREAQRQAELKADAATPTRIRQTLQEFLEKDFQSEQDLRAAVDTYAAEVALQEREGRLVTRLLEASNQAGSIDAVEAAGGSVNEVRNAIESFLSSPSGDLSRSLEETAGLLFRVNVALPVGSTSPVAGSNQHSEPSRRQEHSPDINPRIRSVPPFTGQAPRTSATDAAFLSSITDEIALMEAERRVAEQLADAKHQRQQALLQHQNIQRLIASKKGEEDIDEIVSSAKVIREQKELLRQWQAEQDRLWDLKEEMKKHEQQLEEANGELIPMLAQHRTLKMALDKAVEDEIQHSKVLEEFNWLESEERGAAAGLREPLVQDEVFRLDLLAFKKQSWDDNKDARENRQKRERAQFSELDLSVSKQRQHVSIIKSELRDAQDRVADAEAACEKLCDRSRHLRAGFTRLPTTRHPTAFDQNPSSVGPVDGARQTETGDVDASTLLETAEEDIVYLPGCDVTHGIDMAKLSPGIATEYYYIGEEMEDEGPELDHIKPDVTMTSSDVDLEAPRNWPDNFPLECVAARWSGFVAISTAGKYRFSTESNDGSHLWVSGSLVVDNGGLHGMQKKEGEVALSAGLHAFKADFFVSSGSPGMIVRMSGPDTEDENGVSQEVLLTRCFHQEGWESVR